MVYIDPEREPPPGFETPTAFVATTSLTLPTIEAAWDRERSRWGFGAVPAIYVLDADHVVRSVFIGSTDPATIIAALGD